MGGLLLGEETLLLNEHVQIAPVADFSDDEALAVIIEDFVAFEDVWVIYFEEDFEFRAMQFLQLGGLERF
jgi:hypothetical protein